MKNLYSVLIFTAFVFFANPVDSQTSWQQFYPNTTTTGLAARGNTILAATEFGFTRFDTLGNATNYDAVNSGLPFRLTKKVAIDHADNWWVVHYGGVAKYDGSSWTNWDTTQMGLSFWTSNATVLNASPEGRVGVGTVSRGAAIFENGAWTSLTTTNSGLPSNSVRDIAFGADGKIYFATSAGLAVLDGAVWTVYNTANTGLTSFNDCKSIALTSTGIVWVTAGLNRFAKLETGVWTGYAPADIGLASASGFSIDVLVDAQDRLWLNYSKSISVLEDTTWTHYLESDVGCTLPLSPNSKIKPAMDGAGQYWFWSSSCDLTRFDGQIWNKMKFGGNAPDLPGAVYAITQDSAGNMWFGGDYAENGEVIARKDGENWQAFSPYVLGTTGTSHEVFTAEGDVLGNVWFGMPGGEILRFDGTAWSVLNDVKLAYPQVYDYWTINSDSEGTVWFAGLVGGAIRSNLIRYKAGVWTYFPGDILGLPSNRFIISIDFGPNNTAWFLSNADQLLKFDGVNWENIDLASAGLPFTFARRMAVAPDGAVWLATDAGLARFDGMAWTTFTTANSDIPSDDVHRIIFDKAGGMYIGYNPVGFSVSANIALLRAGVWSLLVPPLYEPGFSDEPWEIFVDRDNRLWFNGFQGAPPIFVYDPMLVSTKEPSTVPTRIFATPNPTAGMLTLHLKTPLAHEASLSVWNSLGQNIHTNIIPQTAGTALPVDLSQMPAGVYWVRLLQEGGAAATVRVVKQ